MGQFRESDKHDIPIASPADTVSDMISWAAKLCAGLSEASLVIFWQWLGVSKEPMREIFTYGTVGERRITGASTRNYPSRSFIRAIGDASNQKQWDRRAGACGDRPGGERIIAPGAIGSRMYVEARLLCSRSFDHPAAMFSDSSFAICTQRITRLGSFLIL